MTARTWKLICGTFVALAVLAPVARADPNDTDLNITMLGMRPDTLQAGGNPNFHLYMRFCDPGFHITSITPTPGPPGVQFRIVTQEPHGLGVGTGNGTRTKVLDPSDPTSNVNGYWSVNPVDANTLDLTTKLGQATADQITFSPGPRLQIGPFYNCSSKEKTAFIREFKLHLPPGLVGNPVSAPACPIPIWQAALCPTSSALGYSVSETYQSGTNDSHVPPFLVPSVIFNVATLGLEPARLGTRKFPSEPPGPLPVVITLDTTGDYGLNSAVTEIPRNLGGPTAIPAEIDTVLCAQVPCTPVNPSDPSSVQPDPTTGVPVRPFFRNPTSCTPAAASLDAASYHMTANADGTGVDLAVPDHYPDAAQGDDPSTSTFTPTGCDQVPFDATVGVQPTETTQAGAGGAQQVTIAYSHNYADDPIWESALRNADVTLPEGMTLSPSGGNGLQSCTPEEFGVNPDTGKQLNNDPVTCPSGAQIGTISVHSPVLDQSLDGRVFFGPTSGPGRPTDANPWKLYLLIEGAGLRIKLVGDTTVLPNGQIRNVFLNQPEVPFDTFDLNIRGGDRAVLANPNDCNNHTGTVKLTGWSGAEKDSAPSVKPDTGCTPQPFGPTVDQAGSTPDQAGANTVSNIVISRTDGQPDIKSLKLSLPVGAVGSLAAVPQCPIAQARAGNCPEDTQVGVVKTTVGTGNSLLTVEGQLYLSSPDEPNDAATLALVVPAKVGPIDLGQVVVINHVKLRASDTGIDATTETIPNVIDGVPLHVRRIEITVNREGFFINPTGCDTRTLTATFTGYGDETSTSSMGLHATGCDALPFNPKLRLIAGGPGLTKTGAHPPLKAIVTQKSGEANIASAKVVLPDILRPNAVQFNVPGGLCSDAQFAVRACPALSHAGDARVITPVLPFALQGPVYVVQETGSVLPKLYVDLKGEGIEVVLRARNAFQGIRTVNTFDGLPDVPQSYFELDIFGGKNGILNAFNNLCNASPRPFDTQFVGQNGKVVKAKPVLEIDGCTSALSAGATIASRTVKVSKKGIAKFKLKCKDQAKACKGRLSLSAKGGIGSKSFKIKAGKSGAVKVKISKKGMKKLRKAKRLKTRATAKVGSKTSRKSVTLIAPKRKH